MAVYASTKVHYFLLAGLFPTVMFWFLDAYYLNQARRFRGLYDDVADVVDKPREVKPFEMRPGLYVGGEYSYRSAFFSRTILVMYVPLALILVGLLLYFDQRLT